MTSDKRQLGRGWPIALQSMQIRMANTRVQHLKETERESFNIVSCERQSQCPGDESGGKGYTHSNEYLALVQLCLFDIVELLNRDLVRSTILVEDGNTVGGRQVELGFSRILNHLEPFWRQSKLS